MSAVQQIALGSIVLLCSLSQTLQAETLEGLFHNALVEIGYAEKETNFKWIVKNETNKTLRITRQMEEGDRGSFTLAPGEVNDQGWFWFSKHHTIWISFGENDATEFISETVSVDNTNSNLVYYTPNPATVTFAIEGLRDGEVRIRTYKNLQGSVDWDGGKTGPVIEKVDDPTTPTSQCSCQFTCIGDWTRYGRNVNVLNLPQNQCHPRSSTMQLAMARLCSSNGDPDQVGSLGGCQYKNFDGPPQCDSSGKEGFVFWNRWASQEKGFLVLDQSLTSRALSYAHPPHGGSNQRFTVEKRGENAYLIKSEDGRCLDIHTSQESHSVGYHAYLNSHCHGGDNQLFRFLNDGTIRDYWKAFCLDMSTSSSRGNGLEVYAAPCHGGLNQQWTRPAACE